MAWHSTAYRATAGSQSKMRKFGLTNMDMEATSGGDSGGGGSGAGDGYPPSFTSRATSGGDRGGDGSGGGDDDFPRPSRPSRPGASARRRRSLAGRPARAWTSSPSATAAITTTAAETATGTGGAAARRRP
ncbi:hypothetical protein THAOC_11202, partial [Thalassiosira oceanica]